MADRERGSRRGKPASGARPDRSGRTGRSGRASDTGRGGSAGGRAGGSGSAGGRSGGAGSSGGRAGSSGAGSSGGRGRGGDAKAGGTGRLGRFGRAGGERAAGTRRGARSARLAEQARATQAARAARAARPQSKARSREGTGGAFGMTGTRRAALLAMVVCALALTIAVPLQTYLAQREELREVNASQETLRAEVGQLERRKGELADPAHLEAEARRRLHYVRPGETPYVVQLPGDAERGPDEERPAATPAADKAWYEQLWDSVAAR
ncbi:FtsB family cell division protein [Saccharothrix australiensis]|uniref:Septum formation initiator n=1 Tax=Saccharothrix australiensis TaxID=2072 RepID=A0A495VUH3_9PSEU|nr:septum formation initiator family protein [Saccharothrix australiensis]RKT52520.1 septum formation initiator [Saccharothrix australiensis]